MRAKSQLGIRYKFRHVLPKSALRNLFYSMIYPHMLYGIMVLENTNSKVTNFSNISFEEQALVISLNY